MPSGNEQLIHFDVNLNLSTLGSKAAILANTPILAANDTGFELEIFKVAMHMKGKTAAEGPLSWGLSSGLSNSQIADAINAVPTKIAEEAVERANRKVQPFEMIPETFTDLTATPDRQGIPYQNRMPIFGRDYTEGDALNFYVFNHDGSALTTGTNVRWLGVMFGRWKDD